jgi:T-complex protein 1 subunit gamma
MEEEYIESLCQQLIKWKPTLIFTEKGVSDLAQHYLMKAGITVVRRVRKTDNNRIARAVGAVIVSRCDEIKESDIGVSCGLFEVRKIGDDYFTYLVECAEPKSCTILLRGASKDVLTEIERNLQDAMCVARNIIVDPRVVPGGGAVEMAIAQHLATEAKSMDGAMQWPYRALSKALEVIPRTLVENCGGSTIRLLTELRAKHAQHTGDVMCTEGIDGNKGELANMTDLKVFEPYLVKTQTLKTAFESSAMLLRIDDIVSGMSAPKSGGGDGGQAPDIEDLQDDGTFGDYRDG